MTRMRFGLDQGKKRVELRGLEPLTSSMPWKRATNCAKAPRERARWPVRNLTDPTFEALGGPAKPQRSVEHEDWQPAGIMRVHEYAPQHAVEDQVRAHDIRQGSSAVEDVALH
jgi:hypothetical protein